MDFCAQTEGRVMELTVLPSPGRNGSYVSLPGFADPPKVLEKLKKVIISPTAKEAFIQFAQQCPSMQETHARRDYLQRSILSCLDEAQQRKMLKHTQTLVSVSICCIKHLRTACDETQWAVDVSVGPAGIYVVKFPHVEDIGYYTTPGVKLCDLISNYPDHFIANAQRIVEHASYDDCDVVERQDAWVHGCCTCL